MNKVASQAGSPEHRISKGASEVIGDKLVLTYCESVLKKSYPTVVKMVMKTLKTIAIRERDHTELKYRKDSWRFIASVQNEGVGGLKLLREDIRVGGFLVKAG